MNKAVSAERPVRSSPEEAEWNIRVDLAAAHRIAVIDGLHEGSWNHFSAVVPGREDHMLVSPEYCHWKLVTASDLDLVDSNGDSIGRQRRFNPSAYSIHFPIHRDCPNAQVVLHAHPTYSMALTIADDGHLRMAEQNALGFQDRVAYYKYDGAISSVDHGKRLADALGDKRVLFLRGHGVLVVGPNIAEAYTDLYQLERACAVQCHALALGAAIPPVADDIMRTVKPGPFASEYKRRHFAAMKRLLDAEQPDYKS